MAIHDDLMSAIFSMDIYNREFRAGLNKISDARAGITSLGEATIIDTSGNPSEQFGFYGVQYEYKDKTVIAFRGTDDDLIPTSFLFSDDIWNGWALGFGRADALQVQEAIRYYNDIAQSQNGLDSENVTLVGHSLGGGLARFVASLFNQTANLFDYLGFDEAAQATVNATRFSEEQLSYNKELKGFVYNDLSPQDVSFEVITAYVPQDSILTIVQNPDLIHSTTLDFGPDVGLFDLSRYERHSISATVLLMYDRYQPNHAWTSIAEDLWKQLFDNDFAKSIGMDFPELSGVYRVNLDFSNILRTIISYSALEKGEMPFGNTAIRAMFDDANDLGLAVASVGDSAPLLTRAAADITKTFVQYAGMLALNDKESELVQNGVIKGVTESGNYSIAVDFSEATWKYASVSVEAIVSKAKLINAAIADDVNVFSLARSEMRAAWGDSTFSVFDTIIYTMGPGYFSSNDLTSLTMARGKSSLFTGTLGSDHMIGTYGNDLILGMDGQDTMSGEVGRDVLFGGAGNDLFVGAGISQRLEGDRFVGGAGIDTLDYTALDAPNGIKLDLMTRTVSLKGSTATSLKDTFKETERYLGSNFADHVITEASVAEHVEGGGGNDHIVGSRGTRAMDGDFLDGGIGWDTLDYRAVNFGLDLNYSLVTRGGGVGQSDNISNFEKFYLTGRNDSVDLPYGETPVVMEVNGGGGVDTFDGYRDTLFDIRSGITSSADGRSTIIIKDFEIFRNVTVVADVSRNADYTMYSGIDYSSSKSAASFYFGRNLGGLVDDAQRVTVNGVKHKANLNSTIYGTHKGDKYDVFNYSGDQHQGMIVTGLGNDVIIFLSAGDDTTFVYTGGNDRYTSTEDVASTAHVDTFVLGNGIRAKDVSFSFNETQPPFLQTSIVDLTVNIKGKGSIHFEDFAVTSSGGGSHLLTRFDLASGGYFNAEITDDILTGFKYVAGQSTDILTMRNGNDRINGTNGADTLYAMFGNDTVKGSAGDDVIFAGPGADIIEGGIGADKLYGGTGNDEYIFNKVSEELSKVDYIAEANELSIDRIVFAEGVTPDNVRLWLDSSGNMNISTNGKFGNIVVFGQGEISDAGSRVEVIQFTDGTIWDLTKGLKLTGLDTGSELNGTLHDDLVDGRGGDDTIKAFAGKDTIDGGYGSDDISGGFGNDRITGGLAGHDTISGEDGNDILRGGNGNDDLSGGHGNDVIFGESGAD